MNKYVFRPYDPIFPSLFEAEKTRLESFLTGDFEIHHIGSTAVPGLGGKGIIDIYIVGQRQDLVRISDEVLKSGYEHRPRVSADQHVFHKINLPDLIEGMRSYHVHIGYIKAPDFISAIKFRDYLRKNPQDLRKYAEVKKKAAEQSNQDKDTYMAIKNPIMEEILEKAMKGS